MRIESRARALYHELDWGCGCCAFDSSEESEVPKIMAALSAQHEEDLERTIAVIRAIPLGDSGDGVVKAVQAAFAYSTVGTK